MKAKLFFATALALLLTGCGDPMPIPADKSAYVGQWKSEEYLMVITKDGTFTHGRPKSESLVKSMTGPISGFSGNNFDVGFSPMTRTFEVSAPPHKEGKLTKMTVDQVEYTKLEEATK